jgi:hypothetical protein
MTGTLSSTPCVLMNLRESRRSAGPVVTARQCKRQSVAKLALGAIEALQIRASSAPSQRRRASRAGARPRPNTHCCRSGAAAVAVAGAACSSKAVVRHWSAHARSWRPCARSPQVGTTCIPRSAREWSPPRRRSARRPRPIPSPNASTRFCGCSHSAIRITRSPSSSTSPSARPNRTAHTSSRSCGSRPEPSSCDTRSHTDCSPTTQPER